jgi:hypothetical protein
MIVFLPFRKKEDLIDGSFQRAFQTYKEGKFSDEMIAIANNIQAIQNSIESGIPENGLSSRTRHRMRRNLTCVMEKRKKWAMKIYCLLLVCYLLFRRGAAEADATVSILISAGSSYKDHNFVRKQKERKIKKLSNSYQMMLTMPLRHRYSR